MCDISPERSCSSEHEDVFNFHVRLVVNFLWIYEVGRQTQIIEFQASQGHILVDRCAAFFVVGVYNDKYIYINHL